MRMSMNEKKALYAFGCPNRDATVERLRFAAALAPDPAAKKLFFTLAAVDNEQHLNNMMALSEMLMKDGIIEDLLNAKTEQDLLDINNKYSL